MTLSIYYQCDGTSLQVANDVNHIPDEAQFVWYDFAQPTASENHILESHFNFNKLEIDDTVNGTPRAKFKAYDTYQYMVLHSIDVETYAPRALNVFTKGRALVTYHHHEIESVTQVLKDLQSSERDLDNQQVALHLLDDMVDRYFEPVYQIEDRVYHFEETHVDDTSNQKLMDRVFQLRSTMIKLKRIVYSMRELVDTVMRDADFGDTERKQLYIQHVNDHLIKQRNILQLAQEMTDEIRANYESYTSFKMNSVMQVLTLVSVIFLPLTLITGIYGMNFAYMPELKWHYSYFVVLSVMLLIAVGFVIYFKKKKWF